MYTIENHHLHLGGGASEKEDSASPREDKILPRTCISFLHTQGTSIDDTPPLIIRNHPPYHLHVALVALLNTCTKVCIIPRRYPTAKHKKSASFSLAAALVVLLNTCTWIYIIPRLYPTLKSSSFSLADDSGPPLQSISVSKHHKSPYSLDASTSH